MINIPKKYQSEYSDTNGKVNGDNKMNYIIPTTILILLVIAFITRNIKKQKDIKKLAKKKLANKKKNGIDPEEKNDEIKEKNKKD